MLLKSQKKKNVKDKRNSTITQILTPEGHKEVWVFFSNKISNKL